ncbi:MAG TPA: cardiolipin synthase [Candidatus Limnocylindria bacterium]|nr:cardiolipin synthase [Candidatus Limnocylindria bacterium]
MALVGIVLLGMAAAACARGQPHYNLPDMAVSDPSFIPTIEAYASAPGSRRNTVQVLLNGDEIFPAQLAAIRSATQTITYAQYFYAEGPISEEIAEAIAERCRAGVRAHVLLDGFGTLYMPARYLNTMTSAGCEVATFRPLSPFSLFALLGYGKSNHRNHRRILVVDGEVGFTGGSGVSPKWMGNGRLEGHWRDTDVRVEGMVVSSLQGAFAENWLESTGNVLGGDPYFPRQPRKGTIAAQVVRSSPSGGSFAMYTAFLLAMSSARQSIYITNPYFLPDSRMVRALTEARARGVRIVVLLPGAIDNNLVRHASRARFGALLAAGVEIYEYQAGLLHAKTMVIDGIWATVGSANLDSRSFSLNDELNLVVYSRDIAGQLEKVFADDLTYSQKVDYAQWRNRSPFHRLLELLSLPIRREM